MGYNEYILSIIDSRGLWAQEVKDSGICERHHIIPKCDGGEPTNLNWTLHENIVWLYPHEHFLAHKYLYYSNKENRQYACAYLMMAFPKGKCKRDYELTPEEYEELIIVARLNMTGLNSPLYGKDPWNKGLTKETDYRVADYAEKVSDARKGVKLPPMTQLHKDKIAATRKKKLELDPKIYSYTPVTKGKKWVHNDIEMILIDKDADIPDGYEVGTGKKYSSYNIKDREAYHKMRSELTSGENNGMFGKGYKVSGGNNGKADKIYTYKGIDYLCRLDLFNRLIEEWYKLSKTALRSFCFGEEGTKLKSKYPELSGAILVRSKSDEDKINKDS